MSLFPKKWSIPLKSNQQQHSNLVTFSDLITVSVNGASNLHPDRLMNRNLGD